MASCNSSVQVLDIGGNGQLRLKLDYSNEMAVKLTKSDAQEPIFKITVVDSEGNTVKEYDNHNDLIANPLSLKRGVYTIYAESGTNPDAAFDAPYYTGETAVTIEPEKLSTAQITCTLKNVKVTVSVSETIKENFDIYDVVVKNNIEAANSITFTKEKIENGAEGYLKATGVLVYSLYFTNIDGDANQCVDQVITGVNPCDHYKFEFDINPNVANIGATSLLVTIDDGMTKKEHTIDLNLDTKQIPTIREENNTNFETQITIPQKAGLIGKFNISTSTGMKNLIFTHSCEALLALEIPYSVDLLTADATVANKLASVGFDYSINGNNAVVDMRKLFSEKLDLGSYTFIMSVTDAENQYAQVMANVRIIPDVEVSTIKIVPKYMSAQVFAQYNTDNEPAGIGFQYKEHASSEWIDYTGAITKDGAKFDAVIKGLKSNTEYDFRAVSAKDVKDENIMMSKTMYAYQPDNFGFDNWNQPDGKTWYPNAENASVWYWDSANKAATSAGAASSTVPEEEHVVKGKAAKLTSITAAGKFAAGNIYSGKFVKLEILKLGVTINQGQPYTCMPVSFAGWYDYRPEIIDNADSPYESEMGKEDQGQIYAILTDWTGPNVVNSWDSSTIVNLDNDPSIIAIAKMDVQKTDKYTPFNIDFEYRRPGVTPSYVMVCCTSSRYADNFTGAKGSVLYVDEFEFVFE